MSRVCTLHSSDLLSVRQGFLLTVTFICIFIPLEIYVHITHTTCNLYTCIRTYMHTYIHTDILML
uniref:Uncharacterized protein n=1 Tax=Anguilla anguilla TaxID=7936 RepID=A0A0E9XG94_ANGAN